MYWLAGADTHSACTTDVLKLQFKNKPVNIHKQKVRRFAKPYAVEQPVQTLNAARL